MIDLEDKNISSLPGKNAVNNPQFILPKEMNA